MAVTPSACDCETGFKSEQITCEFIIPEGLDISKVVTSDSNEQNSHYILRVLNAFRQEEGPANINYNLTLSGVRNPIQTLKTDPFKFITYTREGFSIDLEDKNVTI